AAGLEALRACRGRIVVSGVGKSGLVAQRIAASFRSTATPAVYLHPTEAMHGDLGLIARGDVALLFSKSGESAELTRLLPLFRRIGVPVVAVVGRADSELAGGADVTLALGRIEEAGPLKLVPTTSGTVFHVLGDILVTCLYAQRGITEDQLAFLHPGGVIGSQATLRVRELMHAGDALPRVSAEVSLREGIVEMIAKRLGVTTVVDADGRLAGILTDGDLRRIIHRHGRIDGLQVREVMTRDPRTIDGQALVASAVERMENNPRGPITALVVIDADGRPEGVIHLHDCLRVRAEA
ncbi:MAG: KpsF/GutQ family sugar-phosphate isomerase, partial [Candidatus Eisenbacteria bacterium]|nr:KpsF/GutQ family sugar-phosphate isomerase [Candidatus Eisenbacteria bacterium]